MASITLQESYPLGEFSDEQRAMILGNVGAVELTEGCSLGCPYCGFDAQKTVKKAIKWSGLESLVESMQPVREMVKPFFYWATDPLDYEAEGKTYFDVDELIRIQLRYSPFVSTSVPIGKERYAIEGWRERDIGRLSVSYMNWGRLSSFLGVQPEMLVPALEAIRNPAESVNPADCLAVLSGPKRGGEGSRLIAIGSSFTKYDEVGIGCFNGVLLRLDGAYNIRQVRPSAEHPQGVVYERITADDFSVFELNTIFSIPAWGALQVSAPRRMRSLDDMYVMIEEDRSDLCVLENHLHAGMLPNKFMRELGLAFVEYQQSKESEQNPQEKVILGRKPRSERERRFEEVIIPLLKEDAAEIYARHKCAEYGQDVFVTGARSGQFDSFIDGLVEGINPMLLEARVRRVKRENLRLPVASRRER